MQNGKWTLKSTTFSLSTETAGETQLPRWRQPLRVTRIIQARVRGTEHQAGEGAALACVLTVSAADPTIAAQSSELIPLMYFVLFLTQLLLLPIQLTTRLFKDVPFIMASSLSISSNPELSF